MVENLGFKNTQEGEFKDNLELFIKAENKWLFVQLYDNGDDFPFFY